MKCQELLAALSDYIDGDLDPAICDAFRDHLVDCNPCEIVIDNIRQTITLYSAGEPVELPLASQKKVHDLLLDRWKAKFEGPGSDLQPREDKDR